MADLKSRLRDANARGDFLEAFNLADRALQDNADSLEIAYASVLALARSGATEHAERRYAALRLWERAESADVPIHVDIMALRGRMQKDRARLHSGDQRRRALVEASETYEAAFRLSRDPFPGINAATLAFLSGNHKRAHGLADETSAALDSKDAHQDYHYYATRAEVALLLNDQDGLKQALQRIAASNLGDATSRAATRRQLRDICHEAGVDANILSPINGSTVVHYTGHIFGSDFDESTFAREVRCTLDELNVGFAFGSLAAGADIVLAEAILERGASLHVVMPFDSEEFRRVSVEAFGTRWTGRFDNVIARAHGVSYATEDAFLSHDVLFEYASRLGMGLALLRAQALDTTAVQIAMQDQSRVTDGNVAKDVSTWQRDGRQTIFIDLPRQPQATGYGSAPAGQRVLRAMLFADVRGFSKLREGQLPVFVEHVLGLFARVLARYERHIDHRNTWGDGLYVVMKDATSAASCAADLQAEMASLDTKLLALPDDLGLRVGVHFGPVFQVYDPVMKTCGFMGAHVSRTARIEPITPEGAVYVTEPFAAAVLLEARAEYLCEFVGRIPAAKDYGRLSVYSLKRA